MKFHFFYFILFFVSFQSCGKKTTPIQQYPEATNNTSNTSIADNLCADLIVSNLKIVTRKKKYAIIQCTILNQGDGYANLLGKSDAESDDLKIRAFISGTEKLSRGDFKIGVFPIESYEISTTNISPNGQLTLQVKVPTEKITRYTRFIILQLDAFLTMKECDNTNNYKAIMH